MFKIFGLVFHQVGQLYGKIPSSNHLLLPSHPAAHDFPAGLNKKNAQMLLEHFSHHRYIFSGQARRACQRQRSILLEFDTRGEVEDFQRLVRTVLSENLHILSEIVTFCQYLSLFLSHVVFIVSSGEG